ncbi:hypothetical protein SBV1_2630007 [Verrucomicrobia bacterium]|nr:hypothetical protein SBV1_2630007 [Verrucomicrobiota bacterium]
MVQSGLYEKIEVAQTQVFSYANAVSSASASAVLNLEKPGAGDLLEHFILKAVTCPTQGTFHRSAISACVPHLLAVQGNPQLLYVFLTVRAVGLCVFPNGRQCANGIRDAITH